MSQFRDCSKAGGYIGNMTAVNCGTIVDTPYGMAELLGPGFSSHPENMVVVYASEGNIKVSLVYCGDNCVIYRFRGLDNSQHYWSRMYFTAELMKSEKYSRMVSAAQSIARSFGMYT